MIPKFPTPRRGAATFLAVGTVVATTLAACGSAPRAEIVRDAALTTPVESSLPAVPTTPTTVRSSEVAPTTPTSVAAARPSTARVTPSSTAVPSVTSKPAPTVTTAAAPPPIRRILVGDSITFGAPLYGFVGYGPLVAGATLLGGSAQDPAQFPWEAALVANGPADAIVLQDYILPEQETPTWEAAWRSLVTTAHKLAPSVYVLVGGPGAPFLSSLPAIHITMPAPDNADGVHYTAAGALNLANLVVRVTA